MAEAGVVAAILTALQEAADGCLARVREPDADHQGEWVCTWLDAIDVVRRVAALEGSSTSETALTGPSIAGNAGYRNPAGGDSA